MRSTRRCILLTAFGLGLSVAGGCGPDAQGDPRPPTGDGSAKLAKVPQLYAAFDFSMCPAGTNCAALFAQRVGYDLGPSGTNAVPSPRAHFKLSPDAVWIPEWARLPSGDEGAHYAFEALALGAVHKTWRAACDKAYAEYDRAISGQLASLDKLIGDLNRQPNPYDRLGGLLALAPKPVSGKPSPFSPGSDAVRFRWEAALFEAFEETKRTFVYTFDGHAPKAELLAVMHARQPKEYENDAFCLAAASGQIEGVPALVDTSSWDAGVRSMVRRPVPEERAAYLEKRRAELADVTRAKFAKAMISNPTLPPGVRELSVAKVGTFARDGKKAIVTSIVTREERSGSKLIKSDDNAAAIFEDWPSGVVLEPGDSVTFYGAETSVRELVLKSTPEVEHKSRSYQLEGKHVTKVVTRGKTLVYFK